ncbi:hypothetical protein IFM89_028123 [Coptis chinensis]|uniref:CBS domain-containing protein n=1 Tax=Coptis chinensis TaxID=261450 RepID=A0A835HZ11_9MAGN|nr:hypothetical protein IFM89_028123 [Coptis chinensis]
MACNSIQSLRCPNPRQIPTTRNTTFNSSFLKSKNRTTISFNNNNKGCSSFLCYSTEGGVGVEETNNEPEEEIISGEWPENFSLLNYDDLRAYFEPEIFKNKMEPSTLLGEMMSTTIRTATVEQTLEEIDHHFEIVSGLPVIDDDFVCIGVVSKKDMRSATNGLKAKVGEVMSSPAITLFPNKTVLDAAVLMLKEKFHRIPIVNEGGQVVGESMVNGMVTRTDIFKALEGLPT